MEEAGAYVNGRLPLRKVMKEFIDRDTTTDPSDANERRDDGEWENHEEKGLTTMDQEAVDMFKVSVAHFIEILNSGSSSHNPVEGQEAINLINTSVTYLIEVRHSGSPSVNPVEEQDAFNWINASVTHFLELEGQVAVPDAGGAKVGGWGDANVQGWEDGPSEESNRA
jgi:hypothetical protein